MRSDAYIMITCDGEGCGCEEDLPLCPTVRGVDYDELE